MIKEPKLELENSQTLFRFQTIRAPQTVSEDSLTRFFIQHPNVTGSPLYANSNENFQSNLNSFQAISAKDFKANNVEFFKVSESLLQARSFISSQEFLNKISETPQLSQNQFQEIWDNFSYQVFKGHSQEERDILSTFIYGYFCKANGEQFIQDHTEGETLDMEAFRRFLESKIVVPKEFISPENNPIVITGGGNSNQNAVRPMNFALKVAKEKDLTASRNIAECETVLKKLNETQKKYEVLESNQKAIFSASVETVIETAYQTYLAQFPNGIENETNPPAFVTPKPTDEFDYAELQKTTLEANLSEDQIAYIERYGLSSESSISDIENKLQEVNRTSYEEKFASIPPMNEILVLDGQSFNSSSFQNSNNSLNLCLDYKLGNLVFDMGTVTFANSSEIVTSLTYRIGDSGLFLSGTIFNNEFTISESDPNYANGPISISIRLETNLGNYYETTLNFGYPQSCATGVLENYLASPDNENPIFGIVRQGIMDYRKVEQYICCYVPGEVSHIENVMAREYKSRTTRRLRRSENTTTTETESEREKLTDTSTTEKNEMQEEISKLMQENKDFQLNAGISYSSPSINGFVNGSFAYHTSKEEANNMAKSMAKEMTMKATERILDKTREERVQKIVEEYSDENQHGVDNRQGDKHISGVYRWVDKIYKNVVHNYGKRLIYEFMIPEPASFHELSIAAKSNIAVTMEKPLHPNEVGVYRPSDMNRNQAVYSAGRYEVEIDPEPNYVLSISKSYTGGENQSGPSKFSFNDIVVPDGYRLAKVYWTYDHRRYSKDNNSDYSTNLRATLSIGNKSTLFYKAGNWYMGNESNLKSDTFYFNGDEQLTTDNLAISLATWDIGSFALNVTAVFERTEKLYMEWQSKAFSQMMQGYNEKLKIYEEKLAAIQAQQAETRQTNSMYYREIEQMVLRKNCMAYLLENNFLGTSFVSGTEIAQHNVVQNKALEDYASKVKFLEQAFEWEIMGYQFYPFYWASKSNWNNLYKQETSDKLFTKFLQSGMARVFVTVRPGFEEVVNWYLATGQVWMGSQPPVIGDPLFLSIVDELRQPASIIEEEWESRVPSTLNVIQADTIALNTSGLPCMQTCVQHQGQGFEADTTTLTNLEVKVD